MDYLNYEHTDIPQYEKEITDYKLSHNIYKELEQKYELLPESEHKIDACGDMNISHGVIIIAYRKENGHIAYNCFRPHDLIREINYSFIEILDLYFIYNFRGNLLENFGSLDEMLKQFNTFFMVNSRLRPGIKTLYPINRDIIINKGNISEFDIIDFTPKNNDYMFVDIFKKSNNPTYILGPISLSYHISEKYNKKIYIFGDQHKFISRTCSDQTMKIDSFIDYVLNNNTDKLIDIFLEFEYTEKKRKM